MATRLTEAQQRDIIIQYDQARTNTEKTQLEISKDLGVHVSTLFRALKKRAQLLPESVAPPSRYTGQKRGRKPKSKPSDTPSKPPQSLSQPPGSPFTLQEVPTQPSEQKNPLEEPSEAFSDKLREAIKPNNLLIKLGKQRRELEQYKIITQALSEKISKLENQLAMIEYRDLIDDSE